MDIIQINKELIPYSFIVELSDMQYKFTVKYNPEGDFFTVDVALGADDILYGEKLIYGRTMFDSKQHLPVPYEAIVPFSYNPAIRKITYDNMGDEVFLLVVNPDDVI